MSQVRAYLELLRLPNVFTAMADIFVGFLLAHGALRPTTEFLLLLGASSALYLAGMVLNDVFDVEQDLRERPHRPIPSGRVQVSQARLLGGGLVALGVALGWIASAVADDSGPGVIAMLLAAAVIAYDRIWKRTAMAPLGMGACRFLNIVLGMSTIDGFFTPEHWLVATGIGVYTVGVTAFARTEAKTSARSALIAGAVTILVGVAFLAVSPFVASDGGLSFDISANESREPWMSAIWLLPVAWLGSYFARAILSPEPRAVQAAVKQCIMFFIVLDACVALIAVGWIWAAAILLLLIPALFLGRWIYST